jgi:hypothetical protein
MMARTLPMGLASCTAACTAQLLAMPAQPAEGAARGLFGTVGGR